VAEPLADRRPVFALLAAEGISQVGTMMTIVARPLVRSSDTGSAANTGLVSAALAVGAVVLAVLGDPWSIGSASVGQQVRTIYSRS
jgi:hypothetical protein